MSSVLYLIGKTLGKYEVLQHIGHGGMAEVYKGQHSQLDRMVAIKVLHPFLADEEGFVTRFKREARIVATMRHPNIMQVYDFDHHEEFDIYYMVMEYIDGPTLKSRLAEKSLSQEEAVRIGIAIADALDYAHQRGMVHRDVKPANIMFMQDGQPVLTDFGIAKMLTLSGLTASGAMVGTPAYMAPEVGMGRQGTAASDIYSLGVVLYQMLTGQLPFDSDSPMGMVMQHINETPPPLAQFVPSVPYDVEAVILKAMAKNPAERFEHASAMARALRQAIGAESLDGASTGSLSGEIVTPPPTANASTPSLPRALSDDEEDDRLLRTWPVSTDDDPAVRTPTGSQVDQVEPSQPESRVVPSLRTVWTRIAGSVTFALVVIIVAVVVWLGFRGDFPLSLQPLRARATAVAEPETIASPTDTLVPDDDSVIIATPAMGTMTPTPTATAVPTTVRETPTPVPPTPTLSDDVPSVCVPRIRLDLVRQQPDRVVLPDTAVAVYLSARNAGGCPWPEDLRLAFVSGEQMGAPDAFPVPPLAVGASMQVILPLRAPLDAGVYTSTWEVRHNTGPAPGTAIPVVVEVGAGPTPTSTPEPASFATRVPAPLTLAAPELVVWRDDVVSGTWNGVLVLQAEGGAGGYRYYRGQIRQESLLPKGELTFSWPRCEALPLTVWAVSGEEVILWQGWIDYPAVENCR